MVQEVHRLTPKELASIYGEPFYLLDTQRFKQNYNEFLKAFRSFYPETFIAYSYKTNYTPKLCIIINKKGGYAEVVSKMEFDLAIKLEVPVNKIIFNGPYKDEKTIRKCLLEGGIVNIDSSHEADIVEKIAQETQTTLSVGIRCNFKINSQTSRFGLDINGKEFKQTLQKLKAYDNIQIGIHCHFPDRSLESYATRTNIMLQLADKLQPSFIDIGGGFYGKMPENLKKQFGHHIPTYQEYAQTIAGRIRDHYKNRPEKPKLFLEPGTALVADTMKFVTRVVSIKTVQGRTIATVSGSKYNLGATNVNLPIRIYRDDDNDKDKDKNTSHSPIDIAGCTCKEDDYLYRGYKGTLKRGDYIVFENVGSYSIVLKPPFIHPNCAIIDSSNHKIVKRRETNDDIFKTFVY